MSGSLVADLGIGPEVWLLLSMIGCLTLYFKFSRVWSVRNLDLLLLFILSPGLMMLVGHGGEKQPWLGFVLLFVGSALWLVRCVIDLGLTRRPLLEPNLNAAGLTCLAIGILGLLLTETVSLPVDEGAARNPADSGSHVDTPPPGSLDKDAPINHLLKRAPLPSTLKPKPPQVILKRVLASLAHLGLVAGLIVVGWKHFDRPIAGLAMATCYLILPYTRIALVDSGQIVPAALIIAAVAAYHRPALAGGLIGSAAGFMPACLGLIALWTGFYRGRGGLRFAFVSLFIVATGAACSWQFPDLAHWCRALGARSLADVGLLPSLDAPKSGSIWAWVDMAYRLPVLIGYLALVVITAIWPMEKNLGELIALSAALLVASQFWYLDEGGTLVLLYLPMVILMIFRPNLSTKRPSPLASRSKPAHEPAFVLRS
ncbi:MAG: hypothetical protein NVSMB9_24730 [Isosphaeraceae bacterium]